MSPLTLRRYRAERLLREEFERLRGRVLAAVAGRLRASGVRLDRSDLEASYALAWHGLYAAVLDGQEIANPTGWLVLVTFRRAIDEHRARARIDRDALDADGPGGSAVEDEMASELDDRTRLRQLFEGMQVRLGPRELQAAALCYLQGLSRSEAAARMGVSEARMRKLMEGNGAGRPGVAGKVGALVETIRSGEWCQEQGSLMRGFAYGVLAPDGPRYRLALIHHRECPACRAYVLDLRGLAAVLPPVPCLLQLALAGGAAGGLGASAGAGGIGAGAVSPAGSAVGAGALSATGAAGAGAGAAGGGWLLAGGPLGAKLAVGCLLALGVGAGCVALTEKPPAGRTPHHGHESARNGASSSSAAAARSPYALLAGSGARGSAAGALARAPVGSGGASQPSGASREFGPERSSVQPAAGGLTPQASTASAGARPAFPALPSASVRQPVTTAVSAAPRESATARAVGAAAAQREFAPG